MKTLVLGIGNLLMGDESVGIHVLRHMETHFPDLGADYVDGGTGGFHLLEYFQSYPRVVLIDAAMDGAAPGTVRTIRPRYASDYPKTLTAHDIGLKDLIDTLYLVESRPEIILFTVSIGGFGAMGLELTDAVAAAVEPAARRVADFLRQPDGERPVS